jgi:hypothetical protein
MIVSGETEKMTGRNFIAAEVTLGEALMSYLGVMRGLVDDEELTVMPKVQGAQDYQRFVTDPTLISTPELHNEAEVIHSLSIMVVHDLMARPSLMLAANF